MFEDINMEYVSLKGEIYVERFEVRDAGTLNLNFLPLF